MNICFVYKNYPILTNKKNSGIGIYIENLAKEISKKNKIIILTRSQQKGHFQRGNIFIYSLGWLPKSGFLNKRFLKFFIHNFQIAFYLIYIHLQQGISLIEFPNWEAEGSIFTLFFNGFLNIPIVVRLHTVSKTLYQIEEDDSLSARLISTMEKIFVSCKDTVLTSSTIKHASFCKRIYKLKNKKIKILPIGIKIPKEKQQHSILASSEEKNLNVLFLGRLEKRKGIFVFLKSIKYILKKHPFTNFIIVGEDNLGLKNFVHQHFSVEDLLKVHFLGYVGDRNLLEKLYRLADVCIFPSLYESFGLTIIEAMSLKKAVVASKVGGIANIIEHKKTGLLIKKNDIKDSVDKISLLLSSSELRKKIGEAAFQTVSSRYNLKETAQKSIEFYEKIIARKKHTNYF
ncbi:MAG: glycosyltransferase family 4 protein [Candidatus Woesebacteria bacterium]|jgi:glycosyltransferase involved in cell wall biosynthesis